MARRPDARGTLARRRSTWPLGGLLLVVLCVKAALAVTLADHPLVQPAGDLDAGEYWRLALRVGEGDILLADTAFYVSPLYIYALALMRALSGGSVAGVLLAQAALGTTAVWAVARTTSTWSTPVAGLVAGALVAASGVVALQEAVVGQAALDPLLMAGFLLAFSLALQRRQWRYWLACGLLLALLAVNRPNAWVLLPLCVSAAVCLDAARTRAAGAVVLGVALVLTPLLARNVAVTGEWQVLPGHGGLNLYIGNHAGATGTYTVVEGIRPSMAGQRTDTRRIAAAGAGRLLTDGEVSRHFVGRALGWWRDAPLDALRLTAYKGWLVLHAWELPVNASYAWFREQTWLLWLMPVGAWLLLPLSGAALVTGDAGVRLDCVAAWRWFRWVLPLYLLGVVLTFVVDRYRMPALVVAAVIVSPLLAQAASLARKDMRRAWHALWPAAVVAVVLGAVSLLPAPFDLGQGEADTRMALHAIDARDDTSARDWLALAATRHPTPGVGYYRAGLAWQQRGAWAQAEWALREAHRLDGEVPEVGFALGGVLLSQGKGADALPLLEHAERAGVRPDRVRLDLALAQWQAGDRAGARGTLASGVPVEGRALWRARALAAVDARQSALAAWLLAAYREVAADDAEVAEKLGLMLATEGELASAAAHLEDACRLAPDRATARFNLALVKLQQGHRATAMTLLREALRIDPAYVQAAGALRELGG